jgi:SAM-dependent methyltransferase
VALLYNWTPGYYDRIKEGTWIQDRFRLATPMLQWLRGVRCPLVLDVGTGTGRFPKALLSEEGFAGQVWGLDISPGMLRRARDRLSLFGDRCTLILEDADALPFPDETFDAVACLETLEFTPRPRHALDELVRVLRPGGVLLVSNRIGQARWFPGRAYSEDAFLDLLSRHPLTRAEVHSWNTFYDLVWARKKGQPSLLGRGADDWTAWLRNPERYTVSLSTQDGVDKLIVRRGDRPWSP